MNSFNTDELIQLVLENELGSNFLIMENGTGVIVHHPIAHSAIDEASNKLSSLPPGGIDFSSKKITKDLGLVSYCVDGIFNFVNINDCENKSNTYVAIIGRNSLIKDLYSPIAYTFVANGVPVSDFHECRLSIQREQH